MQLGLILMILAAVVGFAGGIQWPEQSGAVDRKILLLAIVSTVIFSLLFAFSEKKTDIADFVTATSFWLPFCSLRIGRRVGRISRR